MNKRINFEDNIFVLHARIRMIRDLLALDTDPDLFLEKTIDDINFIDRTLEILLGNLAENRRLLEREKAFDDLADLEWQFSQVLAEFHHSSGNISAAQFPILKGSIERLRDRGTARRKIMDESRDLSESSVTEPVVSSVELSELLKEL
jgi:GAF domain-containing protein